MLTCSIILPSSIKIFQTVAKLCSKNEVKIWIRRQFKDEDKQSCHSGRQHSAMTCSIILPHIIQIFQTVSELCSGNQMLTPAQPPPPCPPARLFFIILITSFLLENLVKNARVVILLSSLFMTHCLNVVHALVKFHKYIPYGLGVMVRTQFTIWNKVKGK